ncbi:MAG: YccF domain-containing protein [Bacteroides sp.]|nr:YccF domain-containing protein [Bacteroides sp.]
MKLLFNILWLLFGGLLTALSYLIASLLLMVTIIGIPFGLQTLKMAQLAFWPFNKEIQTVPQAGGCLSVIMNLIWIFVSGFWICLEHLFFGLLLCVTLIGIPFGLQHFKLAALALTPFGKRIVSK